MTERSRDDHLPIDHDKLASLAEFAAGAGHEINNPLAIILGKAQLLLKEEDDPRRRNELASIAAQAYRIKHMIGDLMLFARPPAVVRTTFDASQSVHNSAERFARDFLEKGVTLKTKITAGIELTADQTQFEIVTSELLCNALAVSPVKGEVSLELTNVESVVRLSISDQGPGFSEKDRQHAFDPFYSGSPAGRGLGFGLCKCWRIVTGHGGEIGIESRAGLTQVFSIWK